MAHYGNTTPNNYYQQQQMMGQHHHGGGGSSPGYGGNYNANGGGLGHLNGPLMHHSHHQQQFFHPQQGGNGGTGHGGLPSHHSNGHLSQLQHVQHPHQPQSLHGATQQQQQQQQQQHVPAPPPLEAAQCVEADRDKVFKAIRALYDTDTREQAIADLFKHKDFPRLGFYLWHSTGVIAILLQELINVYPLLQSYSVTHSTSTRIGNAMTVLQTVVTDESTRSRFLETHLLHYYWPFLTVPEASNCPAGTNSKPIECIRLTALGFVGTIAKLDDSKVTSALLVMEIVPNCLRTLEAGSELCRTLATFIIHKLLSSSEGLDYMCTTAPRIDAVVAALEKMLDSCDSMSLRIRRLALRCFNAFAKDSRAAQRLRENPPKCLREGSYDKKNDEDETVKKLLSELTKTLKGE